jgi:hypothetical protein
MLVVLSVSPSPSLSVEFALFALDEFALLDASDVADGPPPP